MYKFLLVFYWNCVCLYLVPFLRRSVSNNGVTFKRDIEMLVRGRSRSLKMVPFEKSKKVKYVNLYSASSRSASNALPLPVSRRVSPQANLQLGISEHCETTWYGLLYHVICLFTPRLSPGTHSSLGKLRLSRPGCLVPRPGGLPVHDGHPPRHQPGLA